MSQELTGYFETIESARRVRDEVIATGLHCTIPRILEISAPESEYWKRHRQRFGVLLDEESDPGRGGTAAIRIDADSITDQVRVIQIMQRYRPVDLEFHA